MKVNFRRIFHYLWPHIKAHKLAFSLIFIGYGVGVVFDDIVKPLIYKELIDLFSSGLARDMILEQAMYLLFLIFLVTITFNIGFRSADFAIAFFQSKVMKRLYDFTFKRLLEHSYHFFSNNFSGSIIAKSRRLVRSYETFADIVSFQIYFSVVVLIGIVTILFFKIPLLAWVFLGWAIIYIFVTFQFIKRKVHYDSLEAEADSLVSARLSDSILNILNIKIFSRNKSEEDSFMEITSNEEKKRRKAWNFGNLQNIAQSSMMAVLQIFVVYVSIKLWYVGEMTVGTFALLQAYMINLFGHLWNLGHSLTRAAKSLTEMQEVIDIFDTPNDIVDNSKPQKLKVQNGHIVFDNVSFSYQNAGMVFEKFNLEVMPGEKVGLVGHSGAGKSTITKLLLRFTEVDKGKILIDGQDITKLTQNDLRSVISYVPQESILFHRTIAENIAYGKPEATQGEIEDVAKKAFAHEFIIKLPQGYETLVGERGIKLSGGERQRIAIARAMLKDSPILILDEATSSLDSVSEHYIQEAFTELMKGKTTVVIAHRLSTVSKMDRIIVLESGDVVEMGTHEELIKKEGVYADLWNHQSGGFLED